MVSHKEFEAAGKEPGLQVWRIENLDLKPVPKALHGSFYTGDAYLLLLTTAAPSHNIHMWLGDECSQDESGAAAIFATQLDDFLGGGPVQFREVQNCESTTFLGYFKSGIKYQDIYQWCGSECNRFERLKASEVAIDIRDNERNGRAKLQMVEEGEEPAKLTEVLGPKTAIAPSTPDDDKVDTGNKKKGVLYMISDASGSMKVTSVAPSSPFKQAMLSPEECYILDNGVDRNIFVWKGPKANVSERKAAMSAGQQFIKDKGYSNKTQIQVLPAGGETTLFKQFFSDWRDKDETTGPRKAYTIGRIAKVEQVPFDASSLHSNKAMAAQHGMVDDGKGKVQIWRVENGDNVPVDPSSYGQFFGGDCYLILYSYRQGSREQHIIYTWWVKQEVHSRKARRSEITPDELAVRVTQGQEPPHLMSLFQGKPMIIHSGGTSRKGGQSKAGGTRLFHIRQSSCRATRAVEVEPTASNLNTNDVFVLKSPKALYVWRGVGASDEEMTAAKHVVGFLGGTVTQVSEGKEPADFWSALGGKKDYQTSKSLQNTVQQPRLFGCSNKTGRLIVEEVPGDFTQSDLATDDVMILDTWDQLFLWVGKDANAEERNGAPKIAKDYVDSDPSGRKGLPITTIKQGAEPPTFTGWFQAWDPKMWDTDPLERIRARF
uniref:Gelsolin-like domain-containing protein n=1 Tax=Amphiprion ocellaris TaxID=80972 RepID=A0AAQ5XAM3_AMPOC